MSESDDDRRKVLRSALSEKFPREHGHLLPALHHVQHVLGYLPDWAMEAVGRHLRVANSEVYGAATSYSELSLSPPPRHTLKVCTGLSCWLNGGGDLLDRLSEDLDVQPLTERIELRSAHAEARAQDRPSPRKSGLLALRRPGLHRLDVLDEHIPLRAGAGT